MRPLPFTWPIGAPFWLAYTWAFSAEWRFVRQARQAAATPDAQDAGSMRLILWAGGLAVFAAFAIALSLRATAMTAGAMPAYLAGIACVVAGGLLRRHSFAMLGERFTYAVRVVPGQAVVERGAYRVIRHPSYAAGLLMFGGIGLALGNWASLAVSGIIPALAYTYRIAVEERALVRTLGPAYQRYMTRTRRLVPFVW